LTNLHKKAQYCNGNTFRAYPVPLTYTVADGSVPLANSLMWALGKLSHTWQT
jgi:hypothetical protein